MDFCNIPICIRMYVCIHIVYMYVTLSRDLAWYGYICIYTYTRYMYVSLHELVKYNIAIYTYIYISSFPDSLMFVNMSTSFWFTLPTNIKIVFNASSHGCLTSNVLFYSFVFFMLLACYYYYFENKKYNNTKTGKKK